MLPRTCPFGKPVAALVGLILLVALSGCATADRWWAEIWEDGERATPSAEAMADEGMEFFSQGSYYEAAKVFEDLKSSYPFHPLAMMAELKAADSHFYQEHYEEARSLYREFEERHPANEAMPYVLFQIAFSHAKQIGTIDRDTGAAAQAVQAFGRLLKTYPDSPYSAEAREGLAAARDHLASHEMYVVGFYVRTGSHTQAEARLESLLANYPDSTVAPLARDLLADLKAGNPPSRSWRSWLPGFSFSEMFTLSEWSLAPGASATSK
ncbi:MAG: outer membrane protein assembly factor BamD [Thermodesulfobacteriota bacterium]